ncbi:hypothetical protein [Streptomyces sp. NPDC006552]|uniref:RNA polymerase sigma factor n=1 Tax=Streptomyces sp. NPDC006552 TaxID=3157179 RepID=UPI0033B1A063
MSIEATFNAIYAEQHPRLVKWLYWKLPSYLPHVAEDYAQEAFADLWEIFQKERTVDYPWALLKKIAQRKMANYYSRWDSASGDSVDFDEPSTALVEAVQGHRYAEGDPEMSLLAGALWEATEAMQAASKKWRALHALTAKMRPLGEPYPTSGRSLARKLREEAARDKAYSDRDQALRELQAACAEVGQLRSELERLGGRGWKSCTGWPPPRQGGGGSRVRTTSICDPTVTECPKGHSLSLETCGFLEDGTRTCRACGTEAGRRWATKRKAGAAS